MRIPATALPFYFTFILSMIGMMIASKVAHNETAALVMIAVCGASAILFLVIATLRGRIPEEEEQ